MGWFDWFSQPVRCPLCSDPGARQTLFGKVKCPNQGCRNFDWAQWQRRESERQRPAPDERAAAGEMRRRVNPRTGEPVYQEIDRAAEFRPGENAIEIAYQNYQGEDKVFVGDRRTIRRRGKHISLCVAPTGTRIALSLDRIENRAEIEALLGRCPTAREARVLAYHASRGTTSPLYERLRARYPDWRPHRT
jgi:hypothetical protein